MPHVEGWVATSLGLTILVALIILALVLRRDRGATRSVRLGVFYERERYDKEERDDPDQE